MAKVQSPPASDPPTSTPSMRRGAADDPTDYEHRHFVNLVAAVFLLGMMLAIVWTVKALQDFEAQRMCFESGRRDCLVIDAPGGHIGVRDPARR